MEQLLIRKLPDGTKAWLKSRAIASDRSVEAEARAILTGTLDTETNKARWNEFFRKADAFRKEFGGIELERPSYPNYEPRNPFDDHS